jgi:tetratricopeptide (TPR) repeat protein
LTDQARLWSGLGTLLTAAEPARAAAALERGVELYRRLGDTRALGKSLLGLGRVRVFMGRFELAAAALAEAYPLLQRTSSPKTLARYFESFASLKSLTGDRISAREHFEHALLLYRIAGAESSMLPVLLNLADMTWEMGDLDAALASFREAVAVIRKSANVPMDMLGIGLTNLAGVHTERGELAEALAVAREGLPLRQGEDLHDALDHLALRAALAGKLAEASRLAGFSDYGWTRRQAIRQPNEVRARDRLQSLLRERFSADELERLFANGAAMSEAEACRLALDDAIE